MPDTRVPLHGHGLFVVHLRGLSTQKRAHARGAPPRRRPPHTPSSMHTPLHPPSSEAHRLSGDVKASLLPQKLVFPPPLTPPPASSM